MESHKKKTVYIIAGPNGAGKTTFAREFLLKHVSCDEFVNADYLALGISPFNPEKAAVEAGRFMIERLDELMKREVDFAFETTLSGRTHIRFIQKLRLNGYRVHLYFLWLPSLEMAISRVKERVKNGGHNIPADTIKRRYSQGLKNLFSLYQPIVDSWTILNSSFSSPEGIATMESGKVIIQNSDWYTLMKMGEK